ncbi:MAG: hypothetical protein AB4040_20015 [Synechococcus sp.]
MNQKIGETLVAAGLLSEAQIQVALADREFYQGQYRTGDVLAMRGWVKDTTVDFFVDLFPQLLDSPRLKIGEYLTLANILTVTQVEELLIEQRQCGVRLGALAVMRGWLKQKTLDFFLEHLFHAQKQQSDLGMRVKLTNDRLAGPATASQEQSNTIELCGSVYNLDEMDKVDDTDDIEELIDLDDMEDEPDPELQEDPWVFG